MVINESWTNCKMPEGTGDIAYTLQSSTCKVFVVKALVSFTVEQILSESWFLWSTHIRKGDANSQKRTVLPWEAFCQTGQIWTQTSGLCFHRLMWWARAGSTGVTLWTSHTNINGTSAKGWPSWPTHSSCSSCPNRVKPFILGFTDKLGLGL